MWCNRLFSGIDDSIFYQWVNDSVRNEHFSTIVAMTGKSAFKLCVQLLTALFPKIKHEWGKRYKNVQSPKNQWEIDNELEDFDSNTLLPEYLNISTRISLALPKT